MKTKLIIATLISALFLGSCSNAAYLPKSGEIDVNRYGSFITVFRTTGKNIRGELLAADSNNLVVLDKVKKAIVPTVIPVKEMKNFELTYAQPKNYGWTIPVFSLVTIAHGWWLIITMPVNFVTTLCVSLNAATAFNYNKKKLPYKNLHMFARFPQGIPPNVDISTLK